MAQRLLGHLMELQQQRTSAELDLKTIFTAYAVLEAVKILEAAATDETIARQCEESRGRCGVIRI